MRQLKWIVALTFVAAIVASPVVAAEYTGSVYAGYSLLNDTDLKETFTKGLVADVAFNVTDSVSVPVEFSWHTKSVDFLGFGLADVTYKTYMGGLRLGGSVYTQVLAGGASASGHVLGLDTGSTTKFALQPGVGIDLPVAEKISVRVGGDYRIIFSNETNTDNLKQWRGHAGIVLHFGGY